jgi:hypothetical protein
MPVALTGTTGESTQHQKSKSGSESQIKPLGFCFRVHCLTCFYTFATARKRPI